MATDRDESEAETATTQPWRHMTDRPGFLEHNFKSHIALTILLLLTMAVSTFTAHALGILAIFLIDAFSITRAELGTLIAVSSLLGAAVAIPAGRGVDLIGAKNALLAVLATSALVFFLYALADNIVIMYVRRQLPPYRSQRPTRLRTRQSHFTCRRGAVAPSPASSSRE